MTDAGGSIAYIHAAFGPLAGFLGGVMIWLSDTLAGGGVAAAFAAAVSVYMPAVADPIGRTLLLAVVLGGLAAINVRGVAKGASFVQVVTIFKLAPLVAFVVLGLALRWHDIPAPTIPAADSLGRAAVFLMFAFSGAETSMALSGEVIEAHKTIPRALLLALGVITLLYGSVHAVAAAALGASLPASTAAPLAEAAARLRGAPMRSLLLAGTAISMLGYLSAIALATPRSVYRIGRVGVLPRALGSVHPRFRTPHVAIIAQMYCHVRDRGDWHVHAARAAGYRGGPRALPDRVFRRVAPRAPRRPRRGGAVQGAVAGLRHRRAALHLAALEHDAEGTTARAGGPHRRGDALPLAHARTGR